MGIKKRYIIALIPVVIVLVGGWNYRWVAEDAYIDFRVVHNILHGYGPVFNPGERVEVYTDPLWVALLTVFSGVFSFISVQWWSVILGLVTSGGGFWLAGLATSSLASKNDDGEALPVGLVCLSVVGGVWMFVTSGLETGLIFGWLGLSWWLLVRALREANRGIYLAALVISLGFAIRPDMALFTLTDGSFLVL
jgi:arabinofuranosyltransferase